MLESEAARGDGWAVGSEEEIIATAVVVEKWESRAVGEIPKDRGHLP